MTADLTPGRPLLEALRAAGFAVRAEGDKLHVSPRGKLTEAEAETVRCMKGPLLAALAEEAETCPACPAWCHPEFGACARTLCDAPACPYQPPAPEPAPRRRTTR